MGPFWRFSSSIRSLSPPSPPALDSPSERQERTKTRRQRPRSVFLTPPDVGPRESSLYPPVGEIEPSYSSLPSFPLHHCHPPATNLEFDIPEYAFFNTQAHADIWEELFVSAHHTTKARIAEHQQQRQRLTSASVLGLTMPDTPRLVREQGMERAMKSEIWVKTPNPDIDDMPPSAVSLHSRLRPVSPPRPTERRSSLYLLPVDQPLLVDDTPSLSSGSSDAGSPRPLESPLPDVGRHGRKPKGLERDLLKVRDGADAKRSSSGVYTPTTFPGAQGPRPSHFPTHVYTPSGFTLLTVEPCATPTNHAYGSSSGVPTRSTSVSSSTSGSGSGSDSSPVTPTDRFSAFASKTLAGLRHNSNQVTPASTSISVHSRESSAGPSTPVSVTRNRDYPSYFPPTSPAGLGVGLGDDTHTTWSPKGSILFNETHHTGLMKSPQQPQAKSRRKPVPTIMDDELVDGVALLHVGETHAL